MEVCFAVLGEVKVNNDVHRLDIDTTGEEVRADEVAADAVAEVVENTVTMGLQHLRVRVETGVAKFGDFLGQKLDSVGAVTEDNGLVDLELERRI
jgi:hypothetical protein